MTRGMRLLSIREVQAKIGGKGRSWIYAQMKRGNFPKQVSLGPGSVAWIEAEIDAWIETLAEARDGNQFVP